MALIVFHLRDWHAHIYLTVGHLQDDITRNCCKNARH